MLPDARTRRARTGRFFGTVMRAEALAYRAVEVASVAGVIVGGTIWYPSGRWTPGVQLRTLPGFVRAFGRRRCGRRLEQALVRTHPRDRHWYLFAIGVDPAHQGSGVASALLRSRLARIDQAGEPAYLESSKLTNVPLYQHFGFEPTEPMELPAGVPVITPMWREPTTPARG